MNRILRSRAARACNQASISGGLRGLAISALLALFVAAPSQAGGLYLYEVSPGDIGLASAGWTVRANDASTIFKNPAGMEQLGNGGYLVGGGMLGVQTEFSPDRTLTKPAGVDGDGGLLLPTLGAYYAARLSENVTFGVGLGGYFGLALEYEDDWVGRYYVQEATLQALTLQPAAAFHLTEKFTIGIGVAAHYGILDQTLAVNNTLPQAPYPDGSLTLDDTAWAFQGNLGLMWDFGNGARIGVQYLSQASLDFDTRPEFSGLRPALELALRAAGLLDSRLDLGMKMPQALRIGVMEGAGEKWEFMADVGWEEWSRFGRVDVQIGEDNPSSLTTESKFEDVWHAGVGASRQMSDAWRLLFGLSWDSAMIEDENRSPALPLGESWRLGLGGEINLGKGVLTVAYEYLYGGDLPMNVRRGPLAGRVAGDYEGVGMHTLAVGWSQRF